MTIDSSVPGLRQWDLRNFRRPMQLDLRNKLEVRMHPRWLFDVMIPHGAPRLPNVADIVPPGMNTARYAPSAIGKQRDRSLSWKDEPCGRQLDGAISPVEVLPEVAAALKGRLAIMVDGGFRRGSDIVKALLLGADAVLLGRAAIYGLAAGGRTGAACAIEILRTEVERVLGLLGCDSIAGLDPACLRWRGAGRLYNVNCADDGPLGNRRASCACSEASCLGMS